MSTTSYLLIQQQNINHVNIGLQWFNAYNVLDKQRWFSNVTCIATEWRHHQANVNNLYQYKSDIVRNEESVGYSNNNRSPVAAKFTKIAAFAVAIIAIQKSQIHRSDVNLK